jgi:hypothetical protein
MIKNKNLKPIDTDIHFKYLCNECGSQHWLSLKEASTPKYRIVCECNNVFQVKTISGYDIKYKKKKVKAKKHTEEIDIDLLDRSVKILVSYGFTKNESINLIKLSYKDSATTDCASLVKQTLEFYNKNYGNKCNPTN